MRGQGLLSMGFIVVLITPLGCGGDGGGQGPCEVSYGEPIVQITGVTDSASGEPVDEIELWDVINERDSGSTGTPEMYEPENIFYVEGISEVEGEDGRFLCEIPCGFGNQDGVISFQFEAPGYQASSHSVEATYSGSEGSGCPVTYTDGTKTTLELQPQ